MIRPTRTAILLAAAAVAVALLPAFVSPGLWRAWVAFVASAALLSGADALLAPPPRSLRITASAPQLLYIGDAPGELRIVVSAPDSWRGAVALFDLDPLFALQPEQEVSAGVPFAVPLLPLRRGEGRLRASLAVSLRQSPEYSSSRSSDQNWSVREKICSTSSRRAAGTCSVDLPRPDLSGCAIGTGYSHTQGTTGWISGPTLRPRHLCLRR